MRTHPCVRLFCIIDTLTSASVLPGIEVIIEELVKRVVFIGHDHLGNMSSYAPLRGLFEHHVWWVGHNKSRPRFFENQRICATIGQSHRRLL
jgi:hypothetical protein